jgi:hypothetical protein
MICCRLIVSGSRTDIDILASAPLEQSEVALHLSRSKANEFANGIKHLACKMGEHRCFIVDITDNLTNIGRYLALTGATIQQPKVVTSF